MFPSVSLGFSGHQQPVWSLLWEAEDALPKIHREPVSESHRSSLALLHCECIPTTYPPTQHLLPTTWKAIILQPNTHEHRCFPLRWKPTAAEVIGNEREDPDPGLDTKVHPVPGE